MVKIFMYELRRMLLSKLFVALAVINGVFAWYVLSSEIVAGVAFTAPFSVWSFGYYLATVMSMAMMTALFLLSNYYSKKERQVEVLTSATPVDAAKYILIRNAVVTLGFVLLCFVAIVLSVFFYASVFGYRDFAVFIVPAIVTIVPGFVFFMGLGHLAGSIRPWLLYVLIPVALAIGFMQTPGVLDFFGGGYFSLTPLTLPVGADGEPAFVLNAAFLLTRAAYLVLGGVLWVISIKRKQMAISLRFEVRTSPKMP